MAKEMISAGRRGIKSVDNVIKQLEQDPKKTGRQFSEYLEHKNKGYDPNKYSHPQKE